VAKDCAYANIPLVLSERLEELTIHARDRDFEDPVDKIDLLRNLPRPCGSGVLLSAPDPRPERTAPGVPQRTSLIAVDEIRCSQNRQAPVFVSHARPNRKSASRVGTRWQQDVPRTSESKSSASSRIGAQLLATRRHSNPGNVLLKSQGHRFESCPAHRSFARHAETAWLSEARCARRAVLAGTSCPRSCPQISPNLTTQAGAYAQRSRPVPVDKRKETG
jgi:hypothetical protein